MTIKKFGYSLSQGINLRFIYLFFFFSGLYPSFYVEPVVLILENLPITLFPLIDWVITGELSLKLKGNILHLLNECIIFDK